MQICKYCNKVAVKINTHETRTGSSKSERKEYVCSLHAALGIGAANYANPSQAGLVHMGNGNYRSKLFRM